MKANLVLGFARWVAACFAGREIAVIVGVIEVDYATEGDAVREACNAAYHQGIQLLRATPGIRFVLYAETSFASAILHEAIGGTEPVEVIPYLAAILVGQAADAIPPFAGERVMIGLVGGSRRERGVDLFPELILALSSRDDVRWILQLEREAARKIDPVFPAYLDWAVAQGLCEWHEGRLDTQTYQAALRRIDVVLMPYRNRYANSGSGVFYEAMQLKRYLVIPEATFMREVVENLAYPCTLLPSTSFHAVLETLISLLDRKAELRRSMHGLAQDATERLPIGRFEALVREAIQA